MKNRERVLGGVMMVMVLASCGTPGEPSSNETQVNPGAAEGMTIDQRSYRLGSIGAFAEMVGAGVKRLALSAPLDPGEMNALIEEAERIAAEHKVGIYQDADFLVTDLFPASLTEGKIVLLICQPETREEYTDLKAEKLRLEDLGQYEGEARLGIARRFGALLSYSDEKIEALLEDRGS